MQKEALDRRLSTRQLDLQSASEVASAKHNTHRKKIAPTKVQPGSSSNQMFSSGIKTAAPPQENTGGLTQEASARDLCNPDPQQVEPAHCKADAAKAEDWQQQIHLQASNNAQASSDLDSCFVTPNKMTSAWGDRSTPPSIGSSQSQTGCKQASPHTNTHNAWGQKTSPSASASHLSRHSAPAAMTPASKGTAAGKSGKAGKNRRIQPMPVQSEERSFSAALGAGMQAGQIAGQVSPAWSGNRAQQPQMCAGSAAPTHFRLSGLNPALESRLGSPRTPQSSNCDSSSNFTPFSLAQPDVQQHNSHSKVLGKGCGNDSPLGSAAKQCWSTPPLAQRSRSGRSQRGSSLGSAGWPASSLGSSQAQANTQHSSPGSTATSKPTWPHMGSQGPMTPPSQARSQAGSTDTCYATPGSTIRVMQDFPEASPAAPSPAGSGTVTPCSARVDNRFAAIASLSSSEQQAAAASEAALPEDVAAARMSQDNAEPLVPAAENAADKANMCGDGGGTVPEAAPVLLPPATRLAGLHAFILAGWPVAVHCS